MISKGYYYVINLDIVSNFYISVGHVSSRFCVRGSIIAPELPSHFQHPCFPSLILDIILYYFKEIPLSQLLPGVMT